MINIVPAWKNKARSPKEEQGIALVSPVGEVELTDEQLEAIYGGQQHGNEEHHEQHGWNNEYHENNGWYYYDHHWWHHRKHYGWYHHGR